jgi:RNA polymerase sigma-70 factor (ECF subfamily)
VSAPVARAAERAARESFGRLVAYLAARSRDVAGAEDALADALVLALERWPKGGVPDNPDAWLLTVARRRLIDRSRRTGLDPGVSERLQLAQDEAEAVLSNPSGFPDERLALLFVCAHPSIDSASRTPLMLQTVLGLSADRIASAFLTSPAAMTKRLTRAKAKIGEAGVPFAIPDRAELAPRLEAVLAAIYAAYGLGWDDAFASGRRADLADEAIWLGRLVAQLLPGEPESKGLLALMLFCEARREARRDAGGGFVALGSQNAALWSSNLIEEAEDMLRRAAHAGRMGRYQLEAAIQAGACRAEAQRPRGLDRDPAPLRRADGAEPNARGARRSHGGSV